MSVPQVEILLSTYNGERFLQPLLNSLLIQTHSSILITVRDDGSEDKTRAILEESAARDSRIRLLPEQTNLGVRGNYSRLLSFAQCDYVMFADQDDVWMPLKVQKTIVKMKEMEQQFGEQTPLALHTDLHVVDANLKLISSSFWKYAKLFPLRAASLNRLLVQNVVTGCTLMINKSLRHSMGSIPTEAIQHDWWIALFASAFGEIGVVEEATIHYRQHGHNVLGALKFSALSYLIQKFSNPPEADFKYRQQNLCQAKTFLTHYHSLLNPKQCEMLVDYCQLLEGRFLPNFHLALRHGFYKNGFMRNLIGLLPKKKAKDLL